MPTASRWPAWFGFLFVALFVAGNLLGPASLPDTSGTDGVRNITDYYAKHSHQVNMSVAAILFVFAGFSFLWFLGGLRARLRSVEDATSHFSNLVLAAGVVFLALFGVAGLLVTSVGSELNFSDSYTFDPNDAIFLGDGSYAFLVAAMLAAGVLMLATWVLARRTRVLPPWLAWTGFVFGIATLGIWFDAWVTPLAFALWVLLVSVVLLRPAGPQSASMP